MIGTLQPFGKGEQRNCKPQKIEIHKDQNFKINNNKMTTLTCRKQYCFFSFTSFFFFLISFFKPLWFEPYHYSGCWGNDAIWKPHSIECHGWKTYSFIIIRVSVVFACDVVVKLRLRGSNFKLYLTFVKRN